MLEKWGHTIQGLFKLKVFNLFIFLINVIEEYFKHNKLLSLGTQPNEFDSYIHPCLPFIANTSHHALWILGQSSAQIQVSHGFSEYSLNLVLTTVFSPETVCFHSLMPLVWEWQQIASLLLIAVSRPWALSLPQESPVLNILSLLKSLTNLWANLLLS